MRNQRPEEEKIIKDIRDTKDLFEHEEETETNDDGNKTLSLE